MARIYEYYGQFEVHTDCADVEKVARALNETAKQFADILKFNSSVAGAPQNKGAMFISNEVEMNIPVNDDTADDEEEADVESA